MMRAMAHIDRHNNYIAVQLEGDLLRPPGYASVVLLKLGEIVIPWPEGLSAEQALLEWQRNG